jgi:hypothetical protein
MPILLKKYPCQEAALFSKSGFLACLYQKQLSHLGLNSYPTNHFLAPYSPNYKYNHPISKLAHHHINPLAHQHISTSTHP